MEINIIGASGEIITYDLRDKLQELYDSIYLEIDNVNNTYKNVCKGIVIDNKVFNHIVQKLISIFDCLTYEEFYTKLNMLSLDNTVSTHAKFLFSKIKVQQRLDESLKKYLNKHSVDVSDDVVDNLFSVKQIEYNLNNTKFDKLFDSFLENTYKSRFIHEDASLVDKTIISVEELKGCKDLSNILTSIDNIKKKHIKMFKSIENIYVSTLSIINYINLALQQKASP